jgi:hypothetical protein
MKGHVGFLGELLLGHLRYGTQGKNKLEYLSTLHQPPYHSFPQPGQWPGISILSTQMSYSH